MSVRSNLNIARGQTGMISIKMTSKPEVKSIIWQKGTGISAKNIQFTGSTKYERIGRLNSATLKIINADESDSGFYTCIADNGYSQGSLMFKINVGGMLFFCNKCISFHINIYPLLIYTKLFKTYECQFYIFILLYTRERLVSYYQGFKNL